MKRNNEFRAGKGQGRKTKPIGIDPERLVIQALSFLADDADQARRFFDWSGLDAATLRRAAVEPGFVLGMLDYFAQNLFSLERFCEAAQIDPGAVIRLHDALRETGRTSHDDL